MGVNQSGFSSNKNPQTTSWEEHGAIGDVSTGRRLKYVQEVPLQTIEDYSNTSTIYIGESHMGASTNQAVWRICRITVATGSQTFEYADGDDSFDNVWDNRTTLAYGTESTSGQNAVYMSGDNIIFMDANNMIFQ